jgi:FAD/FMN-containing dehydrogenase
MTPNGEITECSRSENPELFHAAIGGFGMLGCFVEIVVQLKRVHSGRLRVWAIPVSSLAESLARFKELTPVSDYLVGWMDLYARGAAAGRGLMHRAQHLGEGEDPEDFLTPEKQQLPSRLFGVVPKGWIWPGMWGAAKLGLGPVVNAAKFRAGFHEARSSPFLQPHGGFHFLFDYVPHWHWAWRPGGFIQFQPFIPADAAASTLREIIDRCQSAGFVSHLGVLKQHRVDPFLMTHAVDGFSLALDFAVPSSRAGRERLWQHTHDLADAVLDVGGRFYYAKDATLLESSFERIHGRDAVARFRDLKQQVDPEDLLQTDLSRRLFQGRHPA